MLYHEISFSDSFFILSCTHWLTLVFSMDFFLCDIKNDLEACRYWSATSLASVRKACSLGSNRDVSIGNYFSFAFKSTFASLFNLLSLSSSSTITRYVSLCTLCSSSVISFYITLYSDSSFTMELPILSN